MALMKRGANAALTREIAGLTGLVVGIKLSAGSERVLTDNAVFAAILCNADGRALSDEHFVFTNQLSSPDLSVSELTSLIGDDSEQIEIELGSVPAEVSRIVFILYINEAIAAKRSLGQLKDCTVRVLNLNGGAEIAKSENLAPALGSETALVLGEVYRNASEWKFKVIGQGYDKGLLGVAADFGVSL